MPPLLLLQEAVREALPAGRRVPGSPGTRLLMSIAVETALTT